MSFIFPLPPPSTFFFFSKYADWNFPPCPFNLFGFSPGSSVEDCCLIWSFFPVDVRPLHRLPRLRGFFHIVRNGSSTYPLFPSFPHFGVPRVARIHEDFGMRASFPRHEGFVAAFPRRSNVFLRYPPLKASSRGYFLIQVLSSQCRLFLKGCHDLLCFPALSER